MTHPHWATHIPEYCYTYTCSGLSLCPITPGVSVLLGKRFSKWVHRLTSLFSNRGLCVKLYLLSALPRNALAWVIRKESVCEWVTEYNKAERVYKLLCMFFLIDALGFVKSIMGRRRPLPHIHSADWSLRNQAERQAVNFVLQGIVCVSTCVCNVCRICYHHNDFVWPFRLSCRPSQNGHDQNLLPSVFCLLHCQVHPSVHPSSFPLPPSLIIPCVSYILY